MAYGYDLARSLYATLHEAYTTSPDGKVSLGDGSVGIITPNTPGYEITEAVEDGAEPDWVVGVNDDGREALNPPTLAIVSGDQSWGIGDSHELPTWSFRILANIVELGEASE